MPDPIKITVNGREVETTPDKMVIQAANDAGVYVPYLCYHPGMKPYGACRMCVVEIEGQRGTPASCTLPVRDGMVVNTQTEAVQSVRDAIMDLLLSEHPHGCLTCHRIDLCGPQDICLRHVDVTDRCVGCPKNERCELKDTTRYHTRELNSPLTYVYRGLQVETKDPFYDRDYNLCIVCARCVRACDELRGDVALTMTERAGQVLVGTVMGESLLEAGCEFCGACIDVCPVGALVESDYKWERPKRIEHSICNECPVGCQMTYEVDEVSANWSSLTADLRDAPPSRRERVIRVVPELHGPANHGQACYKGKFGFDHVNDKQRLKRPMIRRDGVLQDVSWEEALDFTAQRLSAYSGEAFSILASPRLTNEDLYVAQKFARVVMRSNGIDVLSNDRPGVVEGLTDVLGYAAGTMSVADLRAASCVVVVSANMLEEQNVAAVPIKQAVREGKQKLIVIDWREVELTRYAHPSAGSEQALWLRPYPGTDSLVLGGMLKVVVEELGVDSQESGATSVANSQLPTPNSQLFEGWDAMVASLAPFTLEAVSRETGVPADQIRAAARLYASSGPAAILYAFDGSTHGTRRSGSRAVANLAVLTGNVARAGAGVLPLRHGGNDQGAWDMGCWPSMLPGHVFVQDASAAARFKEAWGVDLPTASGGGLNQAFDRARDGSLKAMVLLGDHVHLEDGTLGDTAAAFDKLEFLAVVDEFLSPAAQRADVVFPAGAWLEKDGTLTNMERRVQPLRKVFANKAVDAKPEWRVLSLLAQRIGASGFAYESAADVLDEIARVVPEYAGISYGRLVSETVKTLKPSNENPQPTQVMYSDEVAMGLQWPCTAPDDAGAASLYAEGFRAGKARLGELTWHPRPSYGGADLPLVLAHGRVLIQPQREMEVVTEGRRRRNRIKREEELVLHPDDARSFKLSDGQRARVVGAKGEVRAGVVRVDDGVPRGVVSLTTLFGELATSLDASEHPDPMNHVPRLHAIPVRVEGS